MPSNTTYDEFRNMTDDQILAALRQSSGRSIPATNPTGGYANRSLAHPAGSRGGVTASPEYRDAFVEYVRSGSPAELRSMNISVDPSGGYFVPDEFFRTFITAPTNYVDYRALCTVLPTSADVNIPMDGDDGEAYWVNEEGQYIESDETIKMLTLGGHKLTRLQKVSEELLQDSVFPIEDFLARKFKRTYARKEEQAFTLGDGVGKPMGWVNDAEIGKTTAAVDTIEPDEIMDFYYSLGAGYRSQAVWQMNDLTISHVRKMKDGNGNWMWAQSMAAGQPDTLLGRPVVPNNSMPDIGAGKTPIGFGDFGFYYISDRGQPIMQRLMELYAGQGLVGFRMALRMDGKLSLSEAIKLLKMHA